MLLDGRPVSAVPADDRALAYGDGLFETIAAHGGRLQHWQRHYARLAAGAARLGIPCAPAALWEAEVAQALDGQPAPRCVVKLVLSRGGGPRGYAPPEPATPRRLVDVLPWPDEAPAGLAAIICRTRLGRNPALAGMKHLNRLEQVLASRELRAAGADEGLMLDTARRVIAGTRSNLFLIHDGVLVTPALDGCGIAGVMREVILATAADAGIPCAERPVSLGDLRGSTEAFFSNSIIGLRRLASLGEGSRVRRFPPGETVACLRALLEADGLLP